MNKLLITLAGVALTACASAAPEDLQAFPAPEAGMTRYVIRLPALEQEADAQVELIVGRELEVDCNIHRFGAVLSEQVASGWGYRYYVIDRIDGPLSTMKACPEDTRERRFVSAPLGDSLVPYNSRLPMVVYVPDGFDLRYRVWSAGAETQGASLE